MLFEDFVKSVSSVSQGVFKDFSSLFQESFVGVLRAP